MCHLILCVDFYGDFSLLQAATRRYGSLAAKKKCTQKIIVIITDDNDNDLLATRKNTKGLVAFSETT